MKPWALSPVSFLLSKAPNNLEKCLSLFPSKKSAVVCAAQLRRTKSETNLKRILKRNLKRNYYTSPTNPTNHLISIINPMNKLFYYVSKMPRNPNLLDSNPDTSTSRIIELSPNKKNRLNSLNSLNSLNRSNSLYFNSLTRSNSLYLLELSYPSQQSYCKVTLLPQSSSESAFSVQSRPHKLCYQPFPLKLKSQKATAVFRNHRHRETTKRRQLRTSNDVETNPGPPSGEIPTTCAVHRAPVQAITYNVRGLGDEKKLRHLLNYLQQRKAGKNLDFLSCLQETYIEKAGKIPYIWRGNYFLTPGNGHSCGCLTLLSSHLNILASKHFGSRGHILACQKSGEQGVTFIVANVYAPNPNSNEKIEFFTEVFESIAEYQERYGCERVLVMGDFNLILKSSETKNRNYSTQEQRVASIVKDQAINLELKDIWDSYAGFTWRRPNTDIFSTIDRILYSSKELEAVSTNENWSLSFSDHAAIETSFTFVKTKTRQRSKITRLDPNLAKEAWSKREIELKFNEMIATMNGDWDPHMKLEFAKYVLEQLLSKPKLKGKDMRKAKKKPLMRN